MTKKERTIKAVKELIEAYKTGEYSPLYCPLCKIHWFASSNNLMNCIGCPNYQEEQGNCPASNFNTYSFKGPANEYRIEFWEKVLPILEETDDITFTRRGGNFDFNKLREIDISIVKGVAE